MYDLPYLGNIFKFIHLRNFEINLSPICKKTCNSKHDLSENMILLPVLLFAPQDSDPKEFKLSKETKLKNKRCSQILNT